MGVKDFYYSLEEKWYAVLDKIDAHIPIYKIVDPIDTVIPSFILFLIVLLLLVAFGAFFLLSSNQVFDAKFTLVSNDGKPVYDTLITAKLMENNSFVKELSGRTDTAGEVTFSQIKAGSEIVFDINLSKGTFLGSFLVNDVVEERIKLNAPPVKLSPVTKKIFVRTATGTALTNAVTVNFSCEGSDKVSPTPLSATTSGEEIQVTEPVGCILKASVNDSKFIAKSYYVNSLIYDLFLEKPEVSAVKLTVKVREDGFTVNSTNFRVKVSGENSYDSTTSGASETTISVTPVSYLVTVTDSSGNYGIVSKNVDVTKDTELVLAVTKAIKAKITLNVLDESTNRKIAGAIVNVTNSQGREIDSTTTDSDGVAVFSFTDVGDYSFTAKKLGDINGGYFSSTATMTVSGDANLTLELEKITASNLGRVNVLVKDQDGIPVVNAKIMLKHKDTDGIVDLMQEKNYVLTDVNGKATFLAGKVTGSVYAYAIKAPFYGSSTAKTVSIDAETDFTIEIEVGSSIIKVNLFDELGEKIDGTAEILTTDGKMSDSHGLAGLISVEGGSTTKEIKAGQTVYVLAKSETYEDYYTSTVMLWPNKTYTFDITLKKQISEPSIKFDKIYNENDVAVNTMAAGKKYYAKLFIESDAEYDSMLMHFRAGKESMLENDIIAIDSVSAAEVQTETRGTTYDPTKGYAFDSNNLTDGLAKWINARWIDAGKATREVKVWFSIKRTATPNKEIVFYYRAEFDKTRKPASDINETLYSSTYETNTYFVGAESTCEGEFCATNEWLYSQKEELYVSAPYSMKQVSQYNYHVALVNNSGIDFGRTEKKIYLSMSVVGDSADEKRIRINNYKIRDSLSALTNNVPIQKVDNLEISTFEKDSVIDINLEIEGLKYGADIIKFELKSDGNIIYTKEVDIEIVKEKDFAVTISPQFIPAMINTDMEVTVFDEKQNYLPDAIVNSYAKEPGFEEYLLTSTKTDRMGRAIVQSGALFNKSTVIIEVIKEGYSRKRFSTTVSENTVAVTPEELSVTLNTFTKREIIQQVTFANLTKEDLVIKSVTIDAKYKDVINEDAMNGYFNELNSEEKTIPAEDTLDIDLLRIKLANGITGDTMIEPISIKGAVKVIFEEPKLRLLYYLDIPITINVSTTANPDTECLVIKPTGKTSLTTEKAQVRFDFELLNACASENVNIALDSLTVTSVNDLSGIAQISVSSTTGTSTGRTALDGSKREIIKSVPAGAKMYGVITYAPNEDSVGKSVQLPVSFEAKFQNQTVKSNPSTVTFTTNVVNLKECMSITADGGSTAFNERAKLKIDTSKCLGQTIDVILCRNDSGCSGGAEGKITLSKKSFTLNNKSEEIEVYGPSIPGTYGVTVHARTRGSTGFNYIGEMPVTFIEPENKIFKLNKYELLLQGNGAEDAVILTNDMLTQSVKVKADGCVWGTKNSSTDWMKVLTGTMIGAMVGSMIGTGFKTDPKNSTKDKKSGTDSSGGSKGSSGSGVVGDSDLTVQQAAESATLNNSASAALANTEGGGVYNIENGVTTRTYSGDFSVDGRDYTVMKTDISNSVTGNVASSATQYTLYDNATGQSFTGSSMNSVTNQMASYQSTTGAWVSSIWVGQVANYVNPFTDNTWSAPKAGVWQQAPIKETDPKAEAAHFAIWAGHEQGWFALAGAVIGGLLAYMTQDVPCDDPKNDQTVSYTDFVINLEGGTTNVTSPSGTNVDQEIPSDAGDLIFSLDTITPEWDFTDAYYSGSETVAIRFTNSGLDDPLPKYGTLVVNSKKHTHGYDPMAVSNGTSSGSSASYDVLCKKNTFGNYWIGSGTDEGLCSGVSESSYSQKYHIRIISSDPKGEDAYVRKYSSCYMGSLTGSTGEDALPRIKLSWDWDAIGADACDYTNPNYIYCDGSQFMIALTKKLANLDEFLAQNGGQFGCPPSPVQDEIQASIDQVNSQSNTITEGFIGISDVQIALNPNTNQATAALKIKNLSGVSQLTYISYSWKGEGEPSTGMQEFTAPIGETTLTLGPVDVEKYDGIYYFTAVVNGEKGDRIPISRAFVNKDSNGACWVEQSTQRTGGVPNLIYYIDGKQSVSYTGAISDSTELYNNIDFAVYLTRDAFTEDFFSDFKEFYRQQFLQKVNINATQSKIVDYLTSKNFKITKRFTGDNAIEPGLYEVYVNIKSPDAFRVIDENNTRIEIQLLLVKSPSVDSPFYRMPFDGMLGDKSNGRQGYGLAYKNIDADAGGIQISNDGFFVNTFDSALSNGVTAVETTTKSTFEEVNVAPGTRGQIASASVSNNTATLKLAPTFVTPVIGKVTIEANEGKMAYSLNTEKKAIITGGNIAYWTGAAKSKNFYGGNAIDSYQDSPDYRISKLGDNVYGFEFNDISRQGTMLIKTLFFVPADSSSYILNAEDNSTNFWSANSEFTKTIQLGGISEMTYNDQLGNSKISSIQNLFDAVKEGKVCVSSDGSSTSFWWNPAVIETVSGSTTSMSDKELSLIGSVN